MKSNVIPLYHVIYIPSFWGLGCEHSLDYYCVYHSKENVWQIGAQEKDEEGNCLLSFPGSHHFSLTLFGNQSYILIFRGGSLMAETLGLEI